MNGEVMPKTDIRNAQGHTGTSDDPPTTDRFRFPPAESDDGRGTFRHVADVAASVVANLVRGIDGNS